MLGATLAMLAASGLHIPLGGMDMVRHLLSGLPDVNDTGQAAGADVDLWIGPEGTVVACEIPRQVGDEDLVRLICPALEGYRIGSPKRGDGSNAYADISLPIVAFPDRKLSLRNRLNSDLSELRKKSDDERYVQLDALKWRKGWRLFVEIAEDGSVANCTRASKEVREDSAKQACAAIVATPFARRVGIDGEPVRYVKTLEARPS